MYFSYFYFRKWNCVIGIDSILQAGRRGIVISFTKNVSDLPPLQSYQPFNWAHSTSLYFTENNTAGA